MAVTERCTTSTVNPIVMAMMRPVITGISSVMTP